MPVKRNESRTKQPRKVMAWKDTLAASAVNSQDMYAGLDVVWYHGKLVISKANDKCTMGAWVFARSPYSVSLPSLEYFITKLTHESKASATLPPVTGKILEIIQDSTSQHSLVVLDVFQVAATRHEVFGMPVLMRRQDETTISIVLSKVCKEWILRKFVLIFSLPKDILFEYNVQHDCRKAGCSATGRRNIMQERIQATVMESYVEHKPLDEYLINTHAFHNAHLIREILPRDLTSPIPFRTDRHSYHLEIASQLRRTQDIKRRATALKKAEKSKADN